MQPNEVPVYALSLHAPWAWALMYGGKDVENRSLKFPRGVTGRVWIHAGLWPGAGDLPITGAKRDLWDDQILSVVGLITDRYERRDVPTAEALRGHIVGSIEVTGYSENSDSPWYVPGSLAINVRNPQPLATPVPAKGALGWWKVNRHPGLTLQLRGAA